MKGNDNNLESIKISCLGDSSVGKTYLTRKYIQDINLDSTLPTIGIEYLTTQKVLSNGKNYKIYIYDTVGQEKYKSLSLNSIRHCDGVILMYDITNRKTFDSISEWIKNIYEKKDEDYPLVLIGNKCDLEDERIISKEEGLEKAEKYKTIYIETSAKEGINVGKAIEELLDKIIKKKEENKDKEKNGNNIKLDASKNIHKNRRKCCGK